MAINDVYSVSLRQVLHGQVVINVLHYLETTTPAGNPSATLAAAVAASIVPALKAVQSSELGHTTVVAQKIHPAPPTLAVADATGAGNGTLAGSSLPTSMAVVVTKTTAFAGRKYRGRIFVAGLPVSSEDNSQLAAGAFAGFSAVGAAIIANQTGGGGVWKPIVWHRSTKTSTDVTAYEYRQILRNQRRRQVGRGV